MKDRISLFFNIVQTLILIVVLLLLVQTVKILSEVKTLTSKERISHESIPLNIRPTDAVWGVDSAQYTLVAFIDYECPYCQDLFGTLMEFENEYINTGKLKVIFRDLPLNMHPHARKLALAAECSRTKGQYWEFTEWAFRHTGGMTDSLLYTWAGELGQDISLFEACLENPQTKKIVAEDIIDARDMRLRTTPTIFINNQKYEGNLPSRTLKMILNGKQVKQKQSTSACGH